VSAREHNCPIAILDVDGTLVDSVYHQAIAWHRALVSCGASPALWRIHRHIGMGGDQLVKAVCGERFEAEQGDRARDRHSERFRDLAGEVRALDGARDLVAALKERGHRVVLASSASPDDLGRYLDLLDVRELADAWTSAADVDATKPEPDVVQVARERVGGGRAAMVGDSTWDCEAARRAGVPIVGLLTGGFSAAELTQAGAAPVFESLTALRRRLVDTPLSP
jgi:HAD superfamily hydrolase (TIGR01549 family)